MNFVILLFSFSHKCSALVSIRSKKPKTGLSKPDWLCKFTTKPFPLQDCRDIARKDFTEAFKDLFKRATFDNEHQDAGDAEFSLNHVLSYYDIREFICVKFNEHYQALQPNQPNAGWL